MADKPSRALVLFGDGLARFVHPSHLHLHSLAADGFCGFLSLPNSPPSESEDERIVREFAVLLDAYETYLTTSKQDADENSQRSSIKHSLSDRFMGMKAALLTKNSSLKSFGAKLGFSVLQLDELVKACNADLQVNVEALELLKLLGFQEGKVVDTNHLDIIFYHIGAGENVESNEQKVIAADMEYVNSLVGGIMCQAQPGSDISSRLHLSVVMSYGNVSMDDSSEFSVSKSGENSHLSTLLPSQSYTMKGEIPREDVRHHCPMLIAQWQHAVTRKDNAEKFSFNDFKEHGGNLTIPADRFLHEIAFKLWKAPKYGA